MGQTLSEPVVEKRSDEGQNDRVMYGVSSMQGWRISMEDAHACILELKPADSNDKELPSDKRVSFFGVYDGHGGDKVAVYTGDWLHKLVAKQPAYAQGDYAKALADGFLATDRAILSDPKYEDEVSGCTATVGIITETQIYCGNAGDSRTVLGIKGRAKPLSFDHKPQNESEKQRIQAAGGFVDFGRVNGNLALSRAIGDFEFKKSADLPPESQIVTAFPDVQAHDLTGDDEFLVVACDGIWDCQSSQAVVEFVRRGIVAKQELHSIAENLMDNCLASNSETGGVGCDNMTVIIIALLNGKSRDEWYKEIADRVAAGDGPCAPPEYAEFRGPGVHHRYNEDNSDYDMDMDQRTRNFGRPPGHIILLGDGTELSSDSADSDMFDHDDEDRDLDSQVSKGQSDEADRKVREGTPGPSSVTTDATSLSSDQAGTPIKSESPSSIQTEESEPEAKTTATPAKTEKHEEAKPAPATEKTSSQ